MKLAAVLLLAAATIVPAVTRADSFSVSYLAAGVQASAASTSVENFNTATENANGSYTTNFSNSGVTGTYSGNYAFTNADLYGGANGTGKYLSTGNNFGVGNTVTLALSSAVNYFGLWFSALDSGNLLSFYSGDTLLYSFTSADFLKAVGACPKSAYCSNPNSGQDSSEQFAFINFYDTNGSFNKIVLSEANNYAGNFESDNHTIGNITTTPTGTALAPTPEPSSLMLLGTGIIGIAGAARRRFYKA